MPQQALSIPLLVRIESRNVRFDKVIYSDFKSGQYKFYAVQLPALTNIPGYPIIMEGHYATNDPTRYFVGGTLLQRPGLAMIGNSIVAGFGGHCDNFNYTGMLVSVHKSAGTINNIQAMVASPGQYSFAITLSGSAC